MVYEHKSFKHMGIATQFFLLLNVLIMYCGNTFLLNIAPVMMILVFICLFLNAKVEGFSKNAYSVWGRANILPILILGLFTVFIGWQYLTIGYDKHVVLVYFTRYITYTALLLFTPKPDIGMTMIHMEKIYGTICGLSYLVTATLQGVSSGGLLGDYQAVGMMLSLTSFLYMIDFFSEESKKLKNRNLIGFLFCVVCVFITGKRTFSILSVLSFILVFAFTKKKDKYQDFIKILLSVVIGIILAYIFVEPVRHLADRLIFADYTDQYTFSSGRNLLWALALDVFNKNKWYGIGFGCFPQYTAQYYRGNSHAGIWHPHNIYYGLLSNVGIIGTTLFLAFMIVSIILTISVMKRAYNIGNRGLKRIAMYSLMIQLWFVIYGYSGNGIFDTNEMYFYIMAVSLMYSATICVQKGEYNEMGEEYKN